MLHEVFRVLVPGGSLHLLDFEQPIDATFMGRLPGTGPETLRHLRPDPVHRCEDQRRLWKRGRVALQLAPLIPSWPQTTRFEPALASNG